MRVWGWVGVLGIILASTSVRADPILITNFAAANTAGDDSMEFEVGETDGGGSEASEDADVSTQTTTKHTSTTNGHSSTFRAMRTNVTTNESRYYSLFPADLNLQQIAVGIGLHVPTDPGGARTFVEIREGVAGVNRGCFAMLNTNRTVSVYWNTTSTSFGTTAEEIELKSCTGDAQLPCDADGDCPSTCTASCTSGGAGCFWGGVELIQKSFTSGTGAPQVTCELWLNGRASVTGLLSAQGLGTITNVRLGAPRPSAVETGALDWYAGYVAVDDTTRARYGHVAAAIPNADGTTSQWTRSSCGGGVPPDSDCVDDWVSGGAYATDGTTNQVSTNGVGKREDILLTDVDPGTLMVRAVEMVLAARTNNNAGTYTLEPALLDCLVADDCEPLVGTNDSITGPKTTPLVVARLVSTVAPRDGSTAWNAETLARLGVSWTSKAMPGTMYAGGALAYVYAIRPDAPLPVTLQDHNLGGTVPVATCATNTDCCANGSGVNGGNCLCENSECVKDGLITVCGISDSRGGGTLQSGCSGGTNDGDPCSVPLYCNNVQNAAGEIARDIACTEDADCATCTLRRSEASGGRGFHCDADAECADGTCDTGNGVCLQNDAIPCTTDADCINLGTCQEDPTGAAGEYCVESCPGGGTCPERTGWPAFLSHAINANVILNCSQGGETLHGMAANRFDAVMTGAHLSCIAEVGTGKCQCATNADCGAGGTCGAAGVCTAGEADRLACRTAQGTATDCASGKLCVFPACDYGPILESMNDATGAHSPECGIGALAFGYQAPGGACAFGSTVTCVADATCDTDSGGSVSPHSQCVGVTHANGDTPCIGSTASTPCTMHSAKFFGSPIGCNQDATCTALGLDTCIEAGDATALDPVQGVCGCVTDAHCADVKTTLSAQLTSGQTVSMSVASSTGFPSAGTVQIDSEQITFASKTAVTLLTLTRGVNGTSAAQHENAAAVKNLTTNKCHSGKCWRRCTADATCSSPTRAGACDTGNGICKGRCTTPCTRQTCTVNSDCPFGVVADNVGRLHYRAGECVSGRCAHCGPTSTYLNDPDTRGAALRWSRTFLDSQYNAVDVAGRLIDRVTTLAGSASVKPLLIFATEPEWATNTTSGWAVHEYIGRNAVRMTAMTSRFPHMVPFRRIIGSRTDQAALFGGAGTVHFSAFGAEAFGGVGGFGTYLASLSTCAVLAGTGMWAPQQYCKNSTGTFSSTVCTSSAACSGTQSCQARPCTGAGDCDSSPAAGDTCHLE